MVFLGVPSALLLDQFTIHTDDFVKNEAKKEILN